jgi:hypothetical protein
MARNDLIECHSDAHQYCYWRESKVSYYTLTLRCLSERCLYGSRENLNFDQCSRAVCSLANCYTLAGFIFPGGSDHINWESIM